MNTGNKESESDLIKEFNETIENKKKEKKEEETCLNKDDIQSVHISNQTEHTIIIKNSGNDNPKQNRDTAIQTDFNPLFLQENDYQNVIELKYIPSKNQNGNSQTNKNNTILSQKIVEKKYLGKKIKNDSPKNKKTIKNNQYNNKTKLLQEKNKNNYSIKNKETINPIKSNVNKNICKNTGLNFGRNINRYKLFFINNFPNKTNDDNNPNFIFDYNDIKNLKILFNSKEKDELAYLNIHDIHDYHDLHYLLDSHEFYEEQRIFQKNLNNYYGY